ncbi:MAG: FAD-binding protein [Mailhella sp.]|nr:FAD-binding protein [Mailhella sp.]
MQLSKLCGTVVETDVLVIGAGASGVGAALGARAQGARTIVLDKGKLESAGCAGGGNDHYMAVLDEDGPTDTLAALQKFYSKPVDRFSPAMIEKGWYNHMAHLAKSLEQYGVQFAKKADGSYLRTQGFGQPGKWWIHISNGMDLKRRMARMVHDAGAEPLNHCQALRILTDESGRACGCTAWNVLTGERFTILAKTVVSAQGRSATRASANSTGNPYNVWMYPYNTGAGITLGYACGAAVTSLDTYQRTTLEPKGYGCPGMNGINSSGAYEYNAIGERFMPKYDKMAENGVRNNQIRGTYLEQTKYGTPIYMDMRHCDEEVVRELQFDLMPGDKATFGDWADATGTDFQHKLLEVEIGELIYGGMIAVDDNFETRVPNLFSGSVFLYCSGAICGGYEAGAQAGRRAMGMSAAGHADEGMIVSSFDEAFAPMKNDGNLSYGELEEAARVVMGYYMGFQRSETGMAVAARKIDFLKNESARLHAGSYRELMRCIEAKEVLTVCGLAIAASRERKESGRCVYTRVDYPDLNPDMNRPLLLWQENGEAHSAWD